MSRFCLITPYHISLQPRTLREADSLCEAGHDVRVISLQSDRTLTRSDACLVKTRRWRSEAVDLCRFGTHGRSWLFEGVYSKLAESLFRIGLETTGAAARGYVRGTSPLIALASKEPADWFIAHTQGALPVAAAAARRWKSRLGFDCEDLLAETQPRFRSILRKIEGDYLPHCDYISVPSQCLGSRLVENYRIDPPIVLNNSFPLRLRETVVPPAERKRKLPLRLYWMSQTIGPGRGIEEAIEAIGIVGDSTELNLQGRVSDEYRNILVGLAQRHHVRRRLVFHPFQSQDDLVGSMGQFDIGLALERSEHRNYSLTTTNKLFSYFLAGLAVIATDTPGQKEVLEQAPDAGLLYSAGQSKTLASYLKRWIENPGTLHAAQQAAWDAAGQKFCWDVEKEKLFRILTQNPPS